MVMRFYEGCRVVDPFKNFNSIFEYVNKLFELSHNTAIFVVLEPATIATRIDGVLRRIAITPGYTILCSSKEPHDFSTVYILVETTWIESGVLIPYSLAKPCSNKIYRYRIPLEVDEQIGIPHLCTKDINTEDLRKFASIGGLLDLSNNVYNGEGTLKLVPVKDKFFFIAKGLGIKTVYSNVKYSFAKVDIPPGLYALSIRLAVVDGDTILISIGRGYLVAFESLVPVEEYIYPLLLITVHSIPSSEPKARYYIEKLDSK